MKEPHIHTPAYDPGPIREVICAAYFDAPPVWTFRVSAAELARNNDEQLGALIRHRLSETYRRMVEEGFPNA